MNRRRLAQALLLSVALGLMPDCSDRPDPESPERRLLDQAIQALWGQVDPQSLQSIRTVSRVQLDPSERQSAYRLETLVASGSRYREKKSWLEYGFSEVFALGDGPCWASIDSTVVPLTEAEIAEKRLHPLLFEMSRLAPLADSDRFELECLGDSDLEGGEKVERLRVRAHEVKDMELTLDFRRSDHLLRRVSLRRSGIKGEMALLLDDWREISGVRMAHHIESLRDGKPYAVEVRESVELGVQVDDALFRAPIDLNRDAIARKSSMGGMVAFARHFDDPKDVFDTADRLKEWLTDNEIQITGPLAVLGPETSDGGRTASRVVCIAVRRPDPARPVEAHEDFGLKVLEPRTALCLTHVGDEPTADLVERIRKEAANTGLTEAGAAIEVFISSDHRTRQIQLPVEAR